MPNTTEIKAALEQARQRMAELAAEHDELAELLGSPALTQSASPAVQYPIGDKVIIRARDAGVHFGTLQSVDGRTVRLTNSRRMWRWWSAGDEISLSGVARHGLADRDEVRIAGEVAEISILDACEIIAMTDTAIESLENAEVANAR
jgi:hypothetical protein